jgi:excisionase family DNA binding protein
MKLVGVREIAEVLSVKPKTLYQWAELGQIPHIKINGCLRFDLYDITEWIKNCKNKSESGYNSLSKLEARKGGNKNEPL